MLDLAGRGDDGGVGIRRTVVPGVAQFLLHQAVDLPHKCGAKLFPFHMCLAAEFAVVRTDTGVGATAFPVRTFGERGIAAIFIGPWQPRRITLHERRVGRYMNLAIGRGPGDEGFKLARGFACGHEASCKGVAAEAAGGAAAHVGQREEEGNALRRSPVSKLRGEEASTPA